MTFCLINGKKNVVYLAVRLDIIPIDKSIDIFFSSRKIWSREMGKICNDYFPTKNLFIYIKHFDEKIIFMESEINWIGIYIQFI